MTPGIALRLGRVSNLPTVWTNVLAGVVLSGGDARAGAIIALMVSMSLFYVGGMYLNDAFDAESDARERPERPIPSGQASLRTVTLAGYAMLVGGLSLLLWLGLGRAEGTGWTAPAAGLVLGVAVVAYDRWHKANPFSPVLMGICRMLVYITAALAAARAPAVEVYWGALVVLAYLIGLTYAAKQETLQRLDSLWPLAFLAAPFVYALPTLGYGVDAVIVYAGFLGWVLFALSFLVLPAWMDVPRAVVSLIAGISLLDAILIAMGGPSSLVWLAVVGFMLTLLGQRYVPGT